MRITESDPKDGSIVIDDFYVCQCSWMGHTLRFQLLRWDRHSDPELHLEFYLRPWPERFWARFVEAFKYLFKIKSGTVHFDEFELRENDIERMQSILTRFHQLKRLSKIQRDAHEWVKNGKPPVSDVGE